MSWLVGPSSPLEAFLLPWPIHAAHELVLVHCWGRSAAGHGGVLGLLFFVTASNQRCLARFQFGKELSLEPKFGVCQAVYGRPLAFALEGQLNDDDSGLRCDPVYGRKSSNWEGFCFQFVAENRTSLVQSRSSLVAPLAG